MFIDRQKPDIIDEATTERGTVTGTGTGRDTDTDSGTGTGTEAETWLIGNVE